MTLSIHIISSFESRYVLLIGLVITDSLAEFIAEPEHAKGKTDITSDKIDTETTATVIAEEQEEQNAKPKQENPGRCWSCRKKVVFAKQVTNKCRCGM